MCIVVDPPAFIPMFKTKDSEHHEFVQVKNWVADGPGKFVTGGSLYRAQLKKVGSVLAFLTELEKRGKVVRRSDATVDTEHVKVKRIEPNKKFDDPHLVALIRATGCRLICVRDNSAHKYLTDGKFYKQICAVPKLYTGAKNADLLCPKNIAGCC